MTVSRTTFLGPSNALHVEVPFAPGWILYLVSGLCQNYLQVRRSSATLP